MINGHKPNYYTHTCAHAKYKRRKTKKKNYFMEINVFK